MFPLQQTHVSPPAVPMPHALSMVCSSQTPSSSVNVRHSACYMPNVSWFMSIPECDRNALAQCHVSSFSAYCNNLGLRLPPCALPQGVGYLFDIIKVLTPIISFNGC